MEDIHKNIYKNHKCVGVCSMILVMVSVWYFVPTYDLRIDYTTQKKLLYFYLKLLLTWKVSKGSPAYKPHGFFFFIELVFYRHLCHTKRFIIGYKDGI